MLWFPPRTAISVIREAQLHFVRLLGFEGARLEENAIIPFASDCWDYTGGGYPPVMDPYEHAIRFIEERANTDLYFDIVLGEQPKAN